MRKRGKGDIQDRFGKLGREYKQVVFDKVLLAKEVTAEWVTPGHPLFEVVREDVLDRVSDDLQRGSVFYDLHSKQPYLLDVFSASIKDGRGNSLHRKLFVVPIPTWQSFLPRKQKKAALLSHCGRSIHRSLPANFRLCYEKHRGQGSITLYSLVSKMLPASRVLF